MMHHFGLRRPSGCRIRAQGHDMQANRSDDLVRTTFQLLALVALIAASFWIVRPFLVASAWAAMIVVATWPLFLHAQRWLGGRRSLAVASITRALPLRPSPPVDCGVATLVTTPPHPADWAESLETLATPQPPPSLATLPLIGGELAARWQDLSSPGSEDVASRLAPYA